MTKEELDAIRQLTIEQAKETFNQDFGNYDDEYDSTYLKENSKLDGYCQGVEDVLKILKEI